MSVTIIVEDGSNVADANSYVSVDEARTYAENRGKTLPSDDNVLGALLVQAVDYLEGQRARYKGVKTNQTQSLQWPRFGVVIDDCAYMASSVEVLQWFDLGVLTTIGSFPSNQIPKELKYAQCELALNINVGINIAPTVTGGFIVEDTVGPITTKFSEKVRTSPMPTMTGVEAVLKPLYAPYSARPLFGYRA